MASKLLKKKDNSLNLKKKDIFIYNNESKKLFMDREEKRNTIRNSINMFDNLEHVELDHIIYKSASKETMIEGSVVKITERLKKRGNLVSNDSGTVKDPRFGTLEKNVRCSTCNMDINYCQGHNGHLTTDFNMFHPFYRSISFRVLQCICKNCSSLIVSEEEIKRANILEKSGYKRLLEVEELSKKKKKCRMPSCREELEKKLEFFKNDGNNKMVEIYEKRLNCPGGFNYEYKSAQAIDKDNTPIAMEARTHDKKPVFLTPDYVKKLFENITDQELSLLGFSQGSHPLNFITKVIPIIPLSARPHVIRDNIVKEDYLTEAYKEIFENTQKLDIEVLDRNEIEKKILFCYAHLIDNSDQSYKMSPADIFKAIKDRLNGKTGLIRSNLLGKRTNYSGRTVLGPNNTLSFGQLAPPKDIRQILTFKEVVTVYNKEFLEDLAEKGMIVNIIRNKVLRYGYHKTRNNKINIGDEVERFSQDKDIIVFNRQPTLHKWSMLGYECKFQDKLSVGVHLSSVSGHNADFDGDEGNMHLPKTVEAQIEARFLMNTKNCIMNSNSSRPVASLILNSCTGGYILTQQETISEKLFYEGLSVLKNPLKSIEDVFKKTSKENLFSGKNLSSILFPDDFCYKKNDLLIVNGVIIKGLLSSSSLGSSHNSIIQSLYKWYGNEVTSNFITNATFLFNWYIKLYGISVSSSDCEMSSNIKIIKEPIIEKINQDIKNKKDENEIKVIIDNGIELIKKEFEKSFNSSNNFYVMMKSGAKGKIEDLSKIINVVGQQYVNNQRPQLKTSSNKRWLSTFNVNDKSINSRGFAYNCWYDGLNPDELFAAAQASRINLIDTAVRTADVGFLQRKMTKALEDLYINYDGTIRNQKNIIYSFSYGPGFNNSDMVFSTDKIGNKILSFIDLKETCFKINQKYGITENYEKSIKYLFEDFNEEEDEEEDDNFDNNLHINEEDIEMYMNES